MKNRKTYITIAFAALMLILVGPEEADIKVNKISIYSPIAKSLIGKAEGDEVIVKAPAKTIEYEVLEIRFE